MLRKRVLTYGPLIIAASLLAALLFKNPFSQRTLIPNLEPFPDTFHYLVPPRCFLQGRGWRLCRPQEQGITSEVPPVYSLVLLPFFALKNDPRMFYFANVGIAFASLGVFYVIVRKLTNHPLIIGLILFLYVTNYFVYWYPTLAMAENLVLLLVLLAFYLSLKNIEKIKPLTFIALPIVAVLFYLTKPAFAPFSPLFIGWSAVFLYLHRHQFPEKIQKTALVGVTLTLIGILALNIDNIRWALTALSASATKTEMEMRASWFSTIFIREHLPQYVSALFGKSLPFLWDHTPIVRWWVGAMGMIGIGIMLIKKRLRLFGLVLLTTLVSQIIFISGFYVLDARYVYHAIPILMIGCAAFLQWINAVMPRYPKRYLFVGLIATLFAVYTFFQAPILKKQIMLNLKYAEQPWWYISVKTIDTYFLSHPPQVEKKQYLISAAPPYLFDFYATGSYTILPLSPDQDFRNDKRTMVWGAYDYSDYMSLYQSLLKEGNEVYITNYGLGNVAAYHENFDLVQQTFKLTPLENGCYNVCTIYRVELSRAQ